MGNKNVQILETRFFGLLGLVASKKTRSVPVDYSLSAEELCQVVASYFHGLTDHKSREEVAWSVDRSCRRHMV